MTTTDTMDNDLLTIWLRAGELSRDEVRDLITQLHEARRDTSEADDKAIKDVKREMDALHEELSEANDLIAHLEKMIATARDELSRPT